MKKCPFCGADIEDSARFCLYCMQSLVEKEQIPPHQKKKALWLPILAAVLGLILVVALVLFGIQTFGGSTTAAQNPQLSATSPSDPTGTQPFATEQPATAPESQPGTPEDTHPATPDATKPTTPGTAQPTTPTTPQPTTPAPTEPTTPTEPTPTTPTQPTTPTEPEATQPTEPVTTQPTEPHEHSFTVKNAISKYLVEEANCAHGAAYYYICFCGQVGTETYYWGEKADHTVVIDPAVDSTCVTRGLYEGSHCSVCQLVIKEQYEKVELGHRINLNSSPGTCRVCGEAGRITISAQHLPFDLNDTYRLDSCTYVLQRMDDNWRITFSLTYTNISSAVITDRGPSLDLSGTIGHDLPSKVTLNPNESTTVKHAFYIGFYNYSPQKTYTLTFE